MPCSSSRPVVCQGYQLGHWVVACSKRIQTSPCRHGNRGRAAAALASLSPGLYTPFPNTFSPTPFPSDEATGIPKALARGARASHGKPSNSCRGSQSYDSSLNIFLTPQLFSREPRHLTSFHFGTKLTVSLYSIHKKIFQNNLLLVFELYTQKYIQSTRGGRFS